MMGFSNFYFHLLLVSSTISILVAAKNEASTNLEPKNHNIDVKVGLILDFNSSTGFVANSCISMALSDFYSTNPHYTTRLALHPKNSNDVLTAASSALELVNEDQVDAIIGPQYYKEARLVAEIGGKSHVPVISFLVTSSSRWSSQTPYFVQTTVPDSSQLECITSLIQQFGWQDIVVLYQNDTEEESGNNFMPSLTESFQQASIRISYVFAISSSASISHIEKQLRHLRSMQTRVFLVHVTSPDLASRLFYLANKVELMNKGTAWIITDALSSSLSSLDATAIESMEGVLGVRPFIPKSKNLENFKIRWNSFLLTQQDQPNYTEKYASSFNTFCLRVHDTVWALATAVEKIQLPEVKKSPEILNASSSAITNLRISEAGPRLVKEILKTNFVGLSGEFKLNGGQLETPVFQIINIAGDGENGDRTVGYWTQGRGFSRRIASAAGKGQMVVYSKRVDQVLRPIIWPGDSTEKPKAWDVPGNVVKLRVLVPKKSSFTEFVKAQEDNRTKNTYNVTGFSIDVFKAVLHALPFEVEAEFYPFVNDKGESNGTYNELVKKLNGSEAPDAVVGDVTIRANREEYVDFSLPYLESGVVMVVRAEPDRLKNIWIFMKPLSWDLWLSIVAAAIFIGVVLRMLERRLKPQNQLGMLFLFPLAALAFPERNMVGNNWARFVLVVWLFLSYILMQSYTANLSSILTVGQLRVSTDIPPCAGYQENTFVIEILKKLRINGTSYSSMEDYDKALSLGCENGGVDAIFDEIPYMKLFLHKYGSKYKMVGSTYSTGGFGFAFPTGSPLAKPVSEATLLVMEKGSIQQLEKTYFGQGYTTQYAGEDISRDSPSLTSYNFVGLFAVTAFLTLLAWGCFECSFIISRYRDRNAAISRVQSIEMTQDASAENDQQDFKEGEFLSQEESNQQVVQDHTSINIDHGAGS